MKWFEWWNFNVELNANLKLKKGFPNVWHHAKPVWYVEELYLINEWSQLESNYEFI